MNTAIDHKVSLCSTTTDHEKFFSYKNFFLAWEIIRNSLRFEVKDRLALEVFAANRDHHLQILIDLIHSGSYQPETPTNVYAPKTDGTLRPFAYLNMRDRLTYQALGNIILRNSYADIRQLANRSIFAHIPQAPRRDGTFRPYMFLPAFPRNGLSGQFDRFGRQIMSLMGAYRDWGDGWFIKTDVASYYPSIDHALLIELLRRRGWLTDISLLRLLEECLGVWATAQPTQPIRQGIPIGYETSDLLGTLALLPIDEAMSDAECQMLRYADDIYAFVRGKRNATKTLIKLDLLLQKSALIRNPAKTEMKPCTEENVNKKRVERELRKQLSVINTDLNGPLEDSAAAQWELYDKFEKLYSDNLLEDSPRLREVEDELSFILYRLVYPDERAKNVALNLLGLMPHRAIHAAKYLAKFMDDPNVVDALFDVAQNSLYSEARLHCIQEIVEQNEIDNEIIDVLQSWCGSEQDWQLRYEALNWLRSVPDQFDFAWELAHQDPDLHVRAKALQLCFEQAETIEQKVEIINFAFAAEHYYLQALGLFLWRRQADIPRQDLQLSLLPMEYEKLFLTEDEADAAANFRNHLSSSDFNLDINPKFPLYDVFESVIVANQQIIDICDMEPSMNKTVIAVYNLVEPILILCATGQSSTITRKTLKDVVPNLDEQFTSRLARLLGYRELVEQGRYAPANEREIWLKQDVRAILKHGFEILHNSYGLDMPTNEKSTQPTEVFISYSHKDKTWMHEFRTMVKPYELNRKISIWADNELRAGDKWDRKIQEALKRAKVAVILATKEFCASEYIRNHELSMILKAAEEGSMKIVWMLIRACAYEEIGLGSYHCSHDVNKPIADLPDAEKDKVMYEVGQELLRVCNLLQANE